MAFTDRLHNRGSISTGYDIENSLKVEADNTEYAEYAITSTTDRRNFCFSGWVKRTELVNATDGGQTIFGSFTEGNEGVLLRWSRENSNYYDGIQVDIGQGGTNYRSYTSSLYRDTSAWYHIVLAVNTRENTASDRWKLYVNGEQVTSWAQQQFPYADFLTSANLSGSKHSIGAYEVGGTVYGKHCGYYADFHFIDADQGNVTFLPTDFGEFDEDTGIWKPKAYTGSYGTNGFYLDFENSGSLGADGSGNGNNFTLNNITSADQATDTPTNNFCTLNGLTPATTSTYTTEGGTTYNGTWNPDYALMASTFGVSRGKWYWEVKNSGTNGALTGTGAMRYENPNYNNFLSNTDGGIATYYTYGTAANKIYYFDGSGQTNVAYSSFPNAGTGDIISVALDMDNGKIYFAINNTWGNSGNPATSTNPVGLPSGFITGTYTPAATLGSAGTSTAYYNFGGYTEGTISSAASDENGYGTFEYAPPSGYYAICTKNLAEYG